MHRLAPALLILATATALDAASAKELYQAGSPGVVCVIAMRDGVEGCSIGSGFLVDASGRVLTNHHVITVDGKPADRILVFRKPAELSGSMEKDLRDPLVAAVAKADAGLDLALLTLPAGAYAPVLRLDAGRAAPGEPAVAIGHPGHGGLWTLTTGTVSNFLADYGGTAGKDVYQTETAVNPGNSGGPLIAADGAVIGVNTFVIRRNEAGVVLQGLQFAVTSQAALRFLEGAGLARAGLVASAGQVAATTAAQPEPIVPDLKQEPHPYRPQDVDGAVKALEAAVDKALQDLDRQVDAQLK